MADGLIQHPVIDDKVVVSGEKNAAADVFGSGVCSGALTRQDLSKLTGTQVVEGARQHIHADGTKLSILEDCEAGAEVGILIIAVADIFRGVVAIVLACGDEVDHTAAAFTGSAPAIVRALVNLLEMDGHLCRCIDGRAEDHAISGVLPAGQVRICAEVVPNTIHIIPWFDCARCCLRILIRGASGPHDMLRLDWRKALQPGAEVPEGPRWNSTLRVRPLGWMNAARAVALQESAPLVPIIQCLQSVIGLGSLAVKGSGQCIDQPVRHGGELRSDEALYLVVLPQEEIRPQGRPEEGPDIGAEVFRPASAVGIPCLDSGTRVVARVDLDVLLPEIRPGGSHGMIGEEEGHGSRNTLYIGKEVRMAAQHRNHWHKVVALTDVGHEEIDRCEALPLARRHGGVHAVEAIHPPALHLTAWHRAEVDDASARDGAGAAVLPSPIDWQRADIRAGHHSLLQFICSLDGARREDNWWTTCVV